MPPPKRAKGADKPEHKGMKKTRFPETADLSDENNQDEWSRCTKYGRLLRRGCTHARGHNCDPDSLAMWVVGVRKDLQDNKNRNRKFMFDATKPSSK